MSESPPNNQAETKNGFFAKLLSLPNDSTKKTFLVAGLLCLVCSILVSSAAVLLKPMQQENKKIDIKKNIIAVADLHTDGKSIDEVFKQFESKIVDLETGKYVEDMDANSYDQRKASSDPQQSINLSEGQDIAGIGHRAKYAKVYLLKENDQIKQIVLPVHGYGLWSTMYGFLSLESDANTVKGLKFYQQAETPGLGGEIDNPKWQAKWVGKQIFDPQGNLRLKVIRGSVLDDSADAKYQIDGLSGATLTSNGVTNMVHYWLGDNAFGTYLKQFHSEG